MVGFCLVGGRFSIWSVVWLVVWSVLPSVVAGGGRSVKWSEVGVSYFQWSVFISDDG